MPSPTETLKEVEETLHSVIESLIDGQKGLQKLGDELNDPTLKLYFLEESLRRAEFRGDLETILHQEGVHDIKESGTASGAVHRVWGELKAITPFLKPPSKPRMPPRRPTKRRFRPASPSPCASSCPLNPHTFNSSTTM